MDAITWIGNNLALIVGVLLTIGTILGWLYRNFNKMYKMRKKADEFHETVSKHDSQICDITVKIDKLVDVITSQDEQNKKIDCAILRDRIIQSYKFHKEKGSIGALDYENLNELFTQYFARGGNHLISKIYRDFQTWQVSFEEIEEI